MSLPADSARPERSVTKVLQRIPGGSAGTNPMNEACFLLQPRLLLTTMLSISIGPMPSLCSCTKMRFS